MDILKKLSVLLGKVIELSNSLHQLEVEIEGLIDEVEELENDDFDDEDEDEDEEDKDENLE
jgi:predicted ATP-grasp superfamily ATP-dependent carboligase